MVLATSLTVTLLLFEGWLIWSALDNAQLLSLVLRGIPSSFPLVPSKTYGLAHVCYLQLLDILPLAEDLGKAIKGTWKFHHDQHCLEVVRYFEPRHVASGKVGCHLVNSSERVFVVNNLDVHGHFELEVGGDDAGLPIVCLKVGP